MNIDQSQNPVQSSQPIQPPAPIRNDLRSPIMLIIGGLVLLIVGVLSGYMFGTRATKSTNQLSTPPTSTQTQTTQNEPSPTTQNNPTVPSSGKLFTITAINLQFELPTQLVSLGKLHEKLEKGSTGTLFCVKLYPNKVGLIPVAYAGGTECYPSGDDKFVLGGTSKDYEAGREGTFMDRSGYTVQDGKYFAKFTLNRLEEIPSDLVRLAKNQNGVDAIIVRGKSTLSQEFPDGYPMFGTLGDGWIGALVNTNNQTYPGFAVQMKLTSELTEKVFEQLIASFKMVN